ncbi:acetolactate synthase small subunit [Rheinheimera sp.]|uniref:acetolactate synthase small subunit n=1 Tax=Rheinheimera sp. TaxID=1869214 RepID=UPI00307F74D7
MRHIISVLLENESGALARVVGLFAQRGYNIDSLTVAATEDPTMSRLTLVTRGDDKVIEQITKQLHKLIEVVKLMDLSEAAHIERELLMVKVRATNNDQREEVKRSADIFRGQIIDVSPTTYTIQIVGTSEKLEAFIEALQGVQILETVRTGVSGIARGERTLSL